MNYVIVINVYKIMSLTLTNIKGKNANQLAISFDQIATVPSQNIQHCTLTTSYRKKKHGR